MIYVHVPFCRSFCTYCGFYSELCSRKETQQVQNRLFGDYAEAICEEIDSRREEISAARSFGAGCRKDLRFAPPTASLSLRSPLSQGHGQPRVCSAPSPGDDSAAAPDTCSTHFPQPAPDTLYIGGGTPSVLPLPVLERIVRALGPATYEEFTVEVNPDDVVAGGAEYVAGLRALGVNRISMGVQSFDDGILRWMNRRHDAAGAREAFRLLRACGFDNISMDLIFGLSQLSDEAWASTVKEALALQPEHISAYQLSIEEDSILERMVSDGRYAEASDEQCRSQYDTLCRLLAEAGYVHYEISNWARPGREAVHNSAYWRRAPYVGLGPAAHTFSLGSIAHSFSPSSNAHSFSLGSIARSVSPSSDPHGFFPGPGSLNFPSGSDAHGFPPISGTRSLSLNSAASNYSPEAGTPSFSPEIQSWDNPELPDCEGIAPSAPLPSSSFGTHSWNCQEPPDYEETTSPTPLPSSSFGVRSWNTQELPRREAGGRLVRWRAEQEVLSAAEAAEETIMLGLRTASGLPLSTLRALSPSAPIDTLISEGALQLIPRSPNPSIDSLVSAPIDTLSESIVSSPIDALPENTPQQIQDTLPSHSATPATLDSSSTPITATESGTPDTPSVSIPQQIQGTLSSHSATPVTPASSSVPVTPTESCTLDTPSESILFVRIPEDHFFVSDDIIAQLLP